MHSHLNTLQQSKSYFMQNKTSYIETLKVSSYKFRHGSIQLSTRETQVIAGIILGMTAKQMGKSLFLSPRTIEYYLKNVKNKFSGMSRHKIISYVLLNGFPIYKFLPLFT